MKRLFALALSIAICVSGVSVFADAEKKFTARVENKTAKQGEKVELKVELENNTGILAMLFVLDYDDTRLKLAGVVDGGIVDGAVFGNDYTQKPFKLVWNSASETNFTENGTLVTLLFDVVEDAPAGVAEVTLTYKQKNVYDVDLNDVELLVVNGGITVEGETPPVSDEKEDSNVGRPTGTRPVTKPDEEVEEKPEEPDYEVALMNFTDVAENNWFYEGVKYAYDNKLMNGISDTVFAPNNNVTRAMFVTVLYRIAGEPEAGEHNFADVAENSWFSDAVAWASNNGIVTGTSKTAFSPNKEITREQMAAIIYRFAKYRDADLSVGENTNILSYDDAFEISEYAIPAFQYVCGSGVINGTTASTLSPKKNATRAQAAAIFMRTAELLK